VKGGYTVIGFFANLCLLPIVVLKKDKALVVYEFFYKTFSVLIGISIFFYIIVVFWGVELPNSTLLPLNIAKEDHVEYFRYPFLVVCYSYGILMPRFCGLFDEPGVVGTVAAIILVINKMKVRNLYNIPVLLAGILSLSLFFYITIVIYSFLFSSNKVRIGMIVALSLLFVFFSSNEVVNDVLLRRLAFSEKGLIHDNRTIGLSVSWYNHFKESSSYWFGLGNQAHAKYNEGGASYVDLIIDYGIVFFYLYCFTFIANAYVNIRKKKNVLIYIVLFAGIIYQRPFVTMLGYFYLLYIPMVVLSNDNSFRSKMSYAEINMRN
jgi:hypothetical protein